MISAYNDSKIASEKTKKKSDRRKMWLLLSFL